MPKRGGEIDRERSPFDDAVVNAAALTELQLSSAGSFTAALWESPETRVGVSRRSLEAKARKCVGLLHL